MTAEASLESPQLGGFKFVLGRLCIENLIQTPLIIVFHISIWGAGFLVRSKLSKALPWRRDWMPA